MPFAYPLLLDLSTRLAVIVGGGPVAARKAAGLLAGGCGRVRCVAPQFCVEMPQGVERVAGEFEAGQLEGATLVFAATNVPEVNAEVVREARRRGVLVNRADVDEEGADVSDFSTPAIHRDGPVTLTVSADGSPALAARIRDDVSLKVDAASVAMAKVMLKLRPAVRASAMDTQRRRELFRALAGDDALAVLRQGGVAALRDLLVPRFPELPREAF